jgi:hypothetical protein
MKTFTLLLLVFCTVSLRGRQEKSEFDKIQVVGILNPVISLNGTFIREHNGGCRWGNSD